jgi:nucleoside-diphosphate-sugar epimerase
VKVFITGANGFVGSNLCRHFLARGWEVHGLVRTTSDLHFLAGLDARLVFGDLGSPGSFAVPEGVDYVIHAAAITSDTAGDESCRRNILLSAVNLAARIEAMAQPPKRVVVISTALALGFAAANISERHRGRPADFLPYTRYKIEAERLFLSRWRVGRLPVVVLRPGDIFGPYDRVTSARALRSRERGVPLIVGRGWNRFGYCYSGNLSRAVELALLKEGIEGNAYTVTNGAVPTWRAFFTRLQNGLGRAQRVYIPEWTAFALAGVMAGIKRIRPRYEPTLTYYRVKRVVTETTYDISRTVAELGYRPDDDWEQQVEEILAWYLRERRDGFIQ